MLHAMRCASQAALDECVPSLVSKWWATEPLHGFTGTGSPPPPPPAVNAGGQCAAQRHADSARVPPVKPGLQQQ